MDIQILVAGLFVQAFVFAGFCIFLAVQKNRDGMSWAIIGFMFGPIALLTLVGAPVVTADKRSDLPDDDSKAAGRGYVVDGGKQWVCFCGASNDLNRDVETQNCRKCHRNRDFVLRSAAE